MLFKAQETSNNRYIATDEASRLYQADGNFVFESAASGSAGAAITFSEKMRIDSAGNVNVGVPTADTSSNYISVTGGLAGSQLNAQMRFYGKSVSNTGATYETARISGGSTSASYSLSGGLVFSTSSNNGSNVLTLAERMRIESDGQVEIATNGLTVPLAIGSSGTSATSDVGSISDKTAFFRTRITVAANTATTLVSGYGGSVVSVAVNTAAPVADVQATFLVTHAWTSSDVLFNQFYGGNAPTVTFSAVNSALKVTHNHSGSMFFTVTGTVVGAPASG